MVSTRVPQAPARSLVPAEMMQPEEIERQAKAIVRWTGAVENGSGAMKASDVAEYQWQSARLKYLHARNLRASMFGRR